MLRRMIDIDCGRIDCVSSSAAVSTASRFLAGGRMLITVAIYHAEHVFASSSHLGHGMRQGDFFRFFAILSRSASH